jgi:hypothetical protein
LLTTMIRDTHTQMPDFGKVAQVLKVDQRVTGVRQDALDELKQLKGLVSAIMDHIAERFTHDTFKNR